LVKDNSVSRTVPMIASFRAFLASSDTLPL